MHVELFCQNGVCSITQSPRKSETQFSRAMKLLEIEMICAHSPETRGHVERANQTLQDRLIKETHYCSIMSIIIF